MILGVTGMGKDAFEIVSLGLRVLFLDNHYRIYLSEESILHLLKAKKGFSVDHLISKHVRCGSILLQQLSQNVCF